VAEEGAALSPTESADAGAQFARTLADQIRSVMAVKGLHKMAWWGGFIATVSGFCHAEIGPEAVTILMATSAEALRHVPAKGKPQ
jgi:hypothetical protein